MNNKRDILNILWEFLDFNVDMSIRIITDDMYMIKFKDFNDCFKLTNILESFIKKSYIKIEKTCNKTYNHLYSYINDRGYNINILKSDYSNCIVLEVI